MVEETECHGRRGESERVIKAQRECDLFLKIGTMVGIQTTYHLIIKTAIYDV